MPRARGRCSATCSGTRTSASPRARRGALHRARHRHRRFQYRNTTSKALRLAAELVDAGADVHRVFEGVYETVQFAKPAARACARAGSDLRRRAARRVLPPPDDFHEVGAAEPYSEGIIDYLRAVEGADMAALIREPPRDTGPRHRVSLRASSDEIDVSAIARSSHAGGGHRQAAGFRRTRASMRSSSSCAASSRRQQGSSAAAGALAERRRPSRQARRAVVVRALVRDLRRRTGARTGHAGTLDPFATGLLLCCPERNQAGAALCWTGQALL